MQNSPHLPLGYRFVQRTANSWHLVLLQTWNMTVFIHCQFLRTKESHFKTAWKSEVGKFSLAPGQDLLLDQKIQFECKEGGERSITQSMWVTFTPSGKPINKTTAVFSQNYSAACSMHEKALPLPIFVDNDTSFSRPWHLLRMLQCGTKQTSIPVCFS